jgi:poly(A) polymerase
MFKPRQPRIISFEVHGIGRERISTCAVRTTDTLQEHKFTAFVVGGALRDLLLDWQPKDFDVATNATPEEVRGLFRRSRIIGRRFRIVHVMCGREIVEVSTYRGKVIAEETPDERVSDEHGRILRDNVFGTMEQDATRRDFTINALFYDPSTQEIWDYHGGVDDLKKKRLRMIGDAEQRYREDPVRMLRAVRLAAKLGLTLDPDTREPISEMAPLMERVPPARLFDEMLKLLLSGHASACLRQLRDVGLHKGLLPLLDVILEQPLGERFVTLALAQTDERVLAGRPVSPAFLFAALLWHEVLAAWKARQGRGERAIPALENAMDEVLDTQCAKLAITRRLTATMREVWAMQPRFESRSGNRAYRLLEAPRFRMAYDFLALRAASGEVAAELETWWRAFQSAEVETRKAMLLPETGPKKRRRRRKKKRPAAAAPAPEAA